MSPVSLTLQAGESLLVSGPSGCGKSTLARCLSGIIPHLYRGEFHGMVRLGGLRTDTTPVWELADRAGLVLQNPALQMLANTVEEEIIFGLENLGLSAGETCCRLEETIERFDLQAMRKRSPQMLSGGEQQKVALAAAIARNPPVLILDEPLSMLDSTAALDFAALLCRLAREGTALAVCEHRREFLTVLPDFHEMPLDGREISPDYPGDEPPLPVSFPAVGVNAAGLRVRLGAKVVLDDFNLTLPAGQVTAVVGRNGVGKTTLLRALAGLQPCEGRIARQGSDQTPHLGMVFQNPDLQLFNPTVRAEILYRIDKPDQALYAWLLDMLCLRRYEETPPLLISEGEKRRVALATLLMRMPMDGILLDEPALGQDGRHKAILIRLLRCLARAGSVVALATHDLGLASQADRVVLLGVEGILADGPAAEVYRNQTAWEQAGLKLPEWIELPC